MLILKTLLMMAFHCIILNFEKNCPIANKRLFLQKFSKFSQKSEFQLKSNSIELSMFLKYGLTKVKKAQLWMFDLVLNMPL